MCSSYVEASSKGGQRAINKGVLLLLAPPLGFMSLGLAAAYRYGRRRDLERAAWRSKAIVAAAQARRRYAWPGPAE